MGFSSILRQFLSDRCQRYPPTHTDHTVTHTHTHTAHTAVIGEPPLLMTPQHPNVYVYENNSMGERKNLVLPCSLMDTFNVMYQWFRGEGNHSGGSRGGLQPPQKLRAIHTKCTTNTVLSMQTHRFTQQ